MMKETPRADTIEQVTSKIRTFGSSVWRGVAGETKELTARNDAVTRIGVVRAAESFLQAARENIALVDKNRMGKDTARPTRNPYSHRVFSPMSRHTQENRGSSTATGNTEMISSPISRLKSRIFSLRRIKLAFRNSPKTAGHTNT